MYRLWRKDGALFPESVNAPVQYGARITAFIIYLLHYQLLPENRLATLMADLFGVKVATATIARMSRACAERLHGFVETVRDLVAGAPVKHDDRVGRHHADPFRHRGRHSPPVAA
jgi:transposase